MNDRLLLRYKILHLRHIVLNQYLLNGGSRYKSKPRTLSKTQLVLPSNYVILDQLKWTLPRRHFSLNKNQTPEETNRCSLLYIITRYNMTTGRYPFEGDNVYRLLESIGRGEPAPPPVSLGPTLGALLTDMLKREPELRPSVQAIRRYA